LKEVHADRRDRHLKVQSIRWISTGVLFSVGPEVIVLSRPFHISKTRVLYKANFVESQVGVRTYDY